MTIQQLRAQIAALQDATMDENRNFRSDYDEGKFDALSAVDALLDSLQKEPQVKKLAGLQHVNETCKENGNSLTQEPVSKDLEEAAEEWDESLYRSDAFKAGAKWQREKDESTTEDLGEYINELSKQFPEVSFAKLSRIAVRVAKWQKEQMMAKAIDAHCFGFQGAALFSFRLPADNHLVGSEVKVIVVEERNEL